MLKHSNIMINQLNKQTNLIKKLFKQRINQNFKN